MSRAIKFREWDVQNKRYHYWGVGLMGVGTFTSKINPMFQDQQFTGLTDMNGKEIYEGDIVKGVYVHNDTETDLTAIVTYEGCYFAPFGAWLGDGSGLRYLTEIDPKRFEVVGNICL